MTIHRGDTQKVGCGSSPVKAGSSSRTMTEWARLVRRASDSRKLNPRRGFGSLCR